ncbi:MAG TPA: type I-U CRISPR-associated protein Csb2 [Miltoncostaeaceae bacterium]|nr:type I-U CRISPR-associated protein Csb2 [Miltoncostaeaceae bacterium]
MIAIEVDLLFGRYHATPWGQAANEGAPEWPPSPWRLARALVSAWYRTPLDERPDESWMAALLQALSTPAEFFLPRGVVAHTRHYMPLVLIPTKTKSGTTSSPVLDTFVHLESPRLVMRFPDAEIPGDDRSALEGLLSRIPYLGRAESQCILRLLSGESLDDFEGLQAVRALEESQSANGAAVSVLCVAPDVSVEALSVSTAERRKRRLDSPLAGAWSAFLLPDGMLEPPAVRRTPRRRHRQTPTVMRFALEGAALPAFVDTVRVADLFRAATLRRADRLPAADVALLRGRDPVSDAVLEGHRHCHYLPSDEDGDGRIDHLTVWCPAGLTVAMREALDVTRLSSSWRLDSPVHAVSLGVYPEDAAELDAFSTTMRSRSWTSHTPFLAPRFPRRRGGQLREAPRDQLLRELERRGLPAPAQVVPLRPQRTAWGAFRAERDGGRRHRGTLPPRTGWTLTFTEPVRGPVALGRQSHFGLGLFLPA